MENFYIATVKSIDTPTTLNLQTILVKAENKVEAEILVRNKYPSAISIRVNDTIGQ